MTTQSSRSLRHTKLLQALVLGMTMLSAPIVKSQALGTTFTYQGQLSDAGQPATGLYDLQLCLFDSPTNPLPLGCVPDADDVPVENGLFSIDLDFGNAFDGQARYLELRVRAGASSGGYTILAPRQIIRPTPEALRAASASAAPWSGLSGVPAGFADGNDADSGGSVTSIGTGTGLTGGPITGSGSIAIADGGVGSAQIADGGVTAVDIANGAVGTVQLANGAVGLPQIDATQVQARVSGICAIGEYLRGINPDGSVLCESLPSPPRISTVAYSGGVSTSIAIGIDGLPVISAYDGAAKTLKVAHCLNAQCTGDVTATTVDNSGSVGQSSAIAIGNDGLPVISYYDATSTALKVAHCANAACTGAATLTTVDNTDSVGSYTAVAIGSDGLPVISYSDGTANALKVAHCANAACTGVATLTTVDNSPYVGTYTSIAIGIDGLPVISYFDDSATALKVAHCANVACTGIATLTTVDAPNTVGSDTDIAIGSDGLPVISYHDFTIAALKVAHCINVACTGSATLTTIDNSTNNNLGDDTDIAIGSDGLAIISYYDAANVLKLAHCRNAACTGAASLVTLDDSENVGQYTSIAIGSDGLPVISYGTSTGKLKVAKCATRSCL